MGLENLASNFEGQHVDSSALALLNHKQLEELGVAKLNDLAKLLLRASNSRHTHAQSPKLIRSDGLVLRPLSADRIQDNPLSSPHFSENTAIERGYDGRPDTLTVSGKEALASSACMHQQHLQKLQQHMTGDNLTPKRRDHVGEAASYNGPAAVKKEENLPAPFARESCALSDAAAAVAAAAVAATAAAAVAAAARPGAWPVSPAKAPEAWSKVQSPTVVLRTNVKDPNVSGQRDNHIDSWG